jgi:DNA modification methylase
MRGHGINVRWKPLLWFVKGTWRRDCRFIHDYVESVPEKSHHDWQQSLVEASHFIEKLTTAGELVCDPCCGSGTTLLAAKRLERNWVGYETNEQHAKVARARLVVFK